MKKIFVIAEVACSHEGDHLIAKKLVDHVHDSRADAIKFQKFTADELFGSSSKEYKLAKNLEFSDSEWRDLISYAKRKNLQVYVDVFGIKSANFISKLGVDGYKIHVSDITNPYILNYLSRTSKPLLLSTAGCYPNEIHEALRILSKKEKSITLMHGFQGFPTKLGDINLLRLIELKNRFGMQVGLMDHISGDSNMAMIIPLLGICLGASVIEKHITLDRGQHGTDYYSALNPNEFKELVKLIRNTEKAFGSKELTIIGNELQYRLKHKKNTIARKFIRKNTLLTDDLFEFKRTSVKENSIAYFDYRGKKPSMDIQKGSILTRKFLQDQPKIAAVIACRVNSNRLYAKPLQYVGEMTILEHLLAEIQQSKRVDDIVLAISEKPENNIFVEFAIKNNIKFVLGDDTDVLGRIINAAKYVNADTILRITPENPFMYWEKIDELIDIHLKGKYDLSVTIEAPLGSNFELINLKALEISHKLGKSKHRSEFVSLYINENKNRFKIFKYRVNENVRRPNYRLTVDYPEDLLLVRMIYDELGKRNKPIPLERVIKFLDTHPKIAKINIDKKTIYHDMWLRNS